MMTTDDIWTSIGFDADTEVGTQSRLPLPPGKYKAEAVAVALKATKNGKGQMVIVDWLITEGEHVHRHVYQTCLVRHESVQAQAFGRARLKDICVAVGVTGQMTDLDLLLNKPVQLAIAIEVDKTGAYPDKNKVVRVAPLMRGDGSAKDEMNDAVSF